ncbi:hypothetical protein NQ318_009501 [Aromia moschata]|uniref:Uncharacterized protein n=1 Tax=Aromia moschata TaxID=1265417 RepID=A0AAV8Z7G1_9CUCU|nr:hypothetical protein NQ318_009501 [Aromia moschata]
MQVQYQAMCITIFCMAVDGTSTSSLKMTPKKIFFAFTYLHDCSNEEVLKLKCGPWNSIIMYYLNFDFKADLANNIRKQEILRGNLESPGHFHGGGNCLVETYDAIITSKLIEAQGNPRGSVLILVPALKNYSLCQPHGDSVAPSNDIIQFREFVCSTEW